MACSLSAVELEERAGRWRRLAERALVESSYEEGVARLRCRADPGVEAELRELVRLEGECCPFLTLAVSSGDGGLLLEVSGPAEARQMVAAFAAPEALSRPS